MAKRQSKKLSDTQLRRWVTAGEPVAKSDGDGLTFTLSPAGLGAWVLRYRFAGRRRELTLGRYPDLSLAEARRRAATERVRVADGTDVAAVKRRDRHKSVAAWTTRHLCEDYETTTLAHAAPATRKLYSGYLNNWLKPRLGAMLATDVQAADVVAMLKAASAKGAGAMRALHAATRAVFDHACGQAIRADNPAAAIKRSTILKQPPRRRGVALGGDKLSAFVRALGHSRTDLALRLHLITGVRPVELCAAAWSEFDLDAGRWHVPGERTKTGLAYTITLPKQAVAILRKLKGESVQSDFLFPAARGRDRPIPYQTYRAWLWRALDRADIKRGAFKPHDLRRTMRSGLAALGIRYEVAERAINHKLPELAEIYDRNDYATERASALAQWANFLDAARDGANVVPIKRKAR